MHSRTLNTYTNEELAAMISAGAKELTETLWIQVEDLAKWKANRYLSALKLHGSTHGLEFDDLSQIAFLAMLDAITTYKPESGLFATWYVIHIQKAFVESAGLRTKKGRCDPINCSTSLDLLLSDDPDADSLHELIPDPEATAALDSVEEQIWHDQLHDTLDDLLAELPEKSSTVVQLRYYKEKTLAEVASVFRVGTEMARQYELKALRELKKPRNLRRLRPFIEPNFYAGTGLGAFRSTGMSVQERYLIRKEGSRAE